MGYMKPWRSRKVVKKCGFGSNMRSCNGWDVRYMGVTPLVLLLQLRQQQRPAAASRFYSKQSGPALSPQKCPRGVKSGLRKNSSSGGSNRWQLKRGAEKCSVPRCGGRAAFRRRSDAIFRRSEDRAREDRKIGRSRKRRSEDRRPIFRRSDAIFRRSEDRVRDASPHATQLQVCSGPLAHPSPTSP